MAVVINRACQDVGYARAGAIVCEHIAMVSVALHGALSSSAAFSLVLLYCLSPGSQAFPDCDCVFPVLLFPVLLFPLFLFPEFLDFPKFVFASSRHL